MTTYLTEVIPVAKTGSKETLTYYSSKKFDVGSLVSVPLRSRLVSGLVVSAKPALQNKALLRQSNFSLKKIDARQTGASFLQPEFLKTINAASLFFATTPGAIMSAVLPNKIIEKSSELNIETIKRRSKQTGISGDVCAMQTNKDDRVSAYRSLIREEFAKNKSIFILFPTQDEVAFYRKELERGIENYLFELHSGVKTKDAINRINSLIESPHPVVILGTTPYLHVARHDIQTVIVERESSRFYTHPKRPRIDFRIFAEMYAKEHGAKLILSDSLLRTETLKRHERAEISEFRSVRFKYQTQAERVLVDMQKQNKIVDEFQVLSRELKQLIDIVVEDKSHAALLAPRRGLSPITVCSDCGTVAECANCSAPVTLHKKGGDPMFVCHKCNTQRSSEERCKTCNSWNLTPLGIGIEKVEQEIKRHNQKVTIFRFDRDSLSSKSSEKNRINEFYKTPGSILLGTEMMISRLKKPVPYSAVVSLDSLLSLPEYTINEKIIHIILALQSNTTTGFLLQTRDPDKTVFKAPIDGNLSQFYREEIADRKMLGFPPYTVLIKLSVTGTPARVRDEAAELAETFSEHNPLTYNAFIERVRGKHTIHTLIKIPADKWPDNLLSEQLKNLPPYVTVAINPDSIL